MPDYLRGLLRELPMLPSQTAILLGWATELPILVKIDDLPTENQPRSDDPNYWNVWTTKTKVRHNWEAVTQFWQEHSQANN